MTIAQLYGLFTQCTGVTTDSRTISEGVMFFALKGDSFDGNDFALKALEKGARYAVVDRPSLADCDRCLVVENVLKTLQDLARYHRSQFNIPVLAVTGTNGKTTTKELINAVLSAKYKTIATQGNLNNHIGVPLTLFTLNSKTQMAVVEMGASAPGEIASSVNIALPGYGLVTNVGKAHLLGFGSFDGVKRTKGELYDYLQSHSGVVFFNADNPNLREMVSQRPALKTQKYGLDYCGAKVLPVSVEEPFLRIEMPYSAGYATRRGAAEDATCSGATADATRRGAAGDAIYLDTDKCVIRTKLVGGYNADNVLAALCVGEYFEVPFYKAVKAIEAYTPSNNRSQMVNTERNLLIIDAYNANPTSMSASLDNFANTEFAGKALIIGDMLELGEDSVMEHEEILHIVAKVCPEESIFAVGSEFAAAAKNIGSKVKLFPSSGGLKEYLEAHPLSGKTILIKGSRGTKLETILPVL